MSDSQEKTVQPASAVREQRPKAREAKGQQCLRFTPLRSCVTRARSLTKEARGDLALSPIIPVPRLQS